MARTRTEPRNPGALPASLTRNDRSMRCRKHRVIFSAGDAGDALFYIRDGLVMLTVVSPLGKGVVVAILGRGDLLGETCLGGQARRHATATALEDSSLVRIDKRAMRRALRREAACSEWLLSYLLSRTLRIEADLVAQLSCTSEQRLARVLLVLACFGKGGKPAPLFPKINQKTLADLVGTTRSRVSFFLNRFRKRGFIDYNGGMRVHQSLRTVVQRP